MHRPSRLSLRLSVLVSLAFLNFTCTYNVSASKFHCRISFQPKRCPQNIVEFYGSWSPLQFIAAVSIFEDQFESGHAGHGRAEELLWRFTPAFQLRRLAGSRKEWLRWAASEKAAWIKDWAPKPHEHIEYYWLPAPWISPAVLVKGSDSRFHVWDGNHRVGAAWTAGWHT